jgi:hypothetical protein
MSKFTHETQDLIDGLNNINPHIGGDDIHQRCYDLLQPAWLQWSGGYHVPIENTTLRGITVHAAIAGKDFRGPAKKTDAILDFFMKPQRKTGARVFKSRQIDLAVVIDAVDYKHAFEERDRTYELDESGLVIGLKVSINNFVFIDGSRSQLPIDNQQRTQVRAGQCKDCVIIPGEKCGYQDLVWAPRRRCRVHLWLRIGRPERTHRTSGRRLRYRHHRIHACSSWYQTHHVDNGE